MDLPFEGEVIWDQFEILGKIVPKLCPRILYAPFVAL